MTRTIAADPSITSSIIADGAVNPGASIAASPATYPTRTRSMSRGCGPSAATPIRAIRFAPFLVDGSCVVLGRGRIGRFAAGVLLPPDRNTNSDYRHIANWKTRYLRTSQGGLGSV